jgi:hypothetical protein
MPNIYQELPHLMHPASAPSQTDCLEPFPFQNNNSQAPAHPSSNHTNLNQLGNSPNCPSYTSPSQFVPRNSSLHLNTLPAWFFEEKQRVLEKQNNNNNYYESHNNDNNNTNNDNNNTNNNNNNNNNTIHLIVHNNDSEMDSLHSDENNGEDNNINNNINNNNINNNNNTNDNYNHNRHHHINNTHSCRESCRLIIHNTINTSSINSRSDDSRRKSNIMDLIHGNNNDNIIDALETLQYFPHYAQQ